MNVNFLYREEKIGQRELLGCTGSGPASYSQANGDQLFLPSGVYIDFVIGHSMSVSKNYFVRPYPSAAGLRANWFFKWFTAAGNEVANGVNLSAESIVFGIIGGEF